MVKGAVLVKLKNTIVKNNKGAVLVIVAASMILLLGLTALVTDVGYLYFQKRNMQNGADAAALAAAWELPSGNIQTMASDYIAKHSITGVVYAQAQNNSTEVRVDVMDSYPRLFGRVFGSSDYIVSAVATARQRVTIGGFQPFAPHPKNYTYEPLSCSSNVEPILTIEDHEFLKGRDINSLDKKYYYYFDTDTNTGHYYHAGDPILNDYTYVGYDPYTDKTQRLENFKTAVILNVIIGIIVDAQGLTDSANYGLLDMTGLKPAAGKNNLEWWITNPDEFEIEETTSLTQDTEPGKANKIFQSNYEDGLSPIDYMLDQSGGEYFIILPHPSVALNAPHSPIVPGDYLIAKINTDPDDYSCDDFRLTGKIIHIYNPYNPDDQILLQQAGIRKNSPFLIKNH